LTKIANRIKSKEAFERARLTHAGGFASAARFLPEPIFIKSGKGSRVIDLDGNEYIDYMLAYGPLILGHCPKVVTDAVIDQLAKGTMFGMGSELEFMVAEEIVKMVPCIDLVRFTNSGTESVHFVLRLARAYTGREKVIKFEGHYHGWADNILISVHPSPPMGLPNAPWARREVAGQPKNVMENVIVLPWNDLEVVEKTLKNYGHEVAAIIMEPIMYGNGGIVPQEGYLTGIRELTQKHGVVLIFDEIVTGFRLALGGAQEYFGVIPDLCTFGKGFAAGYPIAGFGGRKDIMELVATNQVPHMGTFNANPLCMAATLAALHELSRDDGRVIRYISETGAKLRTRLNNLFEKYRFPMKAVGGDAIFVLNSPVLNLRDYRDFLKLDMDFIHRFHQEMLDEGILFMLRGNFMLSAAHNEQDLEQTLDAAEKVIRRWGNKK
jgi:glutamate-1-semialdehyde 2,1-aminomutase